ncbi:hypothetical protein JCM16303_006800 [Sporobolomyces ruberrimus]
MDSTLPDPLLTLRSTLTSSRSITLLSLPASTEVYSLSTSTHIQFPHLSSSPSFPKDTPTRFYQRPTTNPESDTETPVYDLQTLLFGWQHRDASTAEYLREARNEKVGFVSVTDRKVLMEWLSGKGPFGIEGPENRIKGMTESEKEVTYKVLGNLEGGQGQGGADARDSTTQKRDLASSIGGDGKGQPPPMKKARYTADKGDQEKVKRMLAIMDGPQFGHVVAPNEAATLKASDKNGGGGAHHSRETVLRGERYNNFDSVRSLIAPRLQTLQSAASSSSKPSGPGTGSTPAAAGALKPSGSTKKKQLNPIILISPSSTALITMHNVKDFLQEAKFVPSDQARALAASGGGTGSGYLAEDVVQINHQRASGSAQNGQGGANKSVETRMARYFVVDTVEALGKFGGTGREEEAWDRVVCVMTTGQEWQFKPYKWKEPKELFQNVKGVYPQWSSDPMNAKIKAWNVSELRIDPHKRHIDKSVVADFWRSLETWISTNKPWLSY